MLRSTRNMLAPISRIPPEVLTCIPDSWRRDNRGQDVIALTHACQAWRFLPHVPPCGPISCARIPTKPVFISNGSSPLQSTYFCGSQRVCHLKTPFSSSFLTPLAGSDPWPSTFYPKISEISPTTYPAAHLSLDAWRYLSTLNFGHFPASHLCSSVETFLHCVICTFAPFAQSCPRTLENLGNLLNFNEICLHFSIYRTCIIQFTGPNGRVNFELRVAETNAAHIAIGFLGSLDVSKTGLLKLICIKPLWKCSIRPPSADEPTHAHGFSIP